MIQLRRILVPTDFSESARRALDYGLSCPHTICSSPARWAAIG